MTLIEIKCLACEEIIDLLKEIMELRKEVECGKYKGEELQILQLKINNLAHRVRWLTSNERFRIKKEAWNYY